LNVMKRIFLLLVLGSLLGGCASHPQASSVASVAATDPANSPDLDRAVWSQPTSKLTAYQF